MVSLFANMSIRTVSMSARMGFNLWLLPHHQSSATSLSNHQPDQLHYHLSWMISVVVIKHPDIKKRRGGRGSVQIIIPGLSSIIVGKTRQELQIANHITVTAKRRKGVHYMFTCLLACPWLDFSTLKKFRNLFQGNSATHSGLDLPTTINLIKTITHRYIQRPTQYR